MDEARIHGSDIKLIREDDDTKLVTFADGLCKIQIGKSFGSGFLCGFKCGSKGYVRGMFTNNHVLDHKQKYTMIRGSCTNVISADEVEDFWTDKKLDVTFVTFKRKFANVLGSNTWYYFAVADEETTNESSVKILQHPDGGRASVSKGTIIYSSNDTLHYDASTLPGSSGSPLIDTDYRVFGIHKQKGPLCDENDARQGVSYNIGAPIRRAIELMSGETKITSTSNETNSMNNESRPPIKPRIKSRYVQFSPETLADGEQANDLRKELEDLRHILKQESVEKETLAIKMKDLDDEKGALKRSLSRLRQKLEDRGIQLFQYSAEARRRAEVEKFGGCRRCILCSASGLFNVGTGGGLDWRGRWRRMMDGREVGLWWWLMMPHPVDNLVVWMQLERRDDTLLIQTQYHKYYQSENPPPQFTIDCEVSLIMEKEDGTSTTSRNRKQHKITLVDHWLSSDFMTFPAPKRGVVNPQKPPIVQIELINTEL